MRPIVMVAMKNPHRGGEQLPLLVPPTTWSPPVELPDLAGRGVTHLALDTETCDHRLGRDQGPGWPYRDGYVCGVSAAWRQGAEMCSIYVPLRHPDSACFSVDQVRSWLRHTLQSVQPVFQNSHYDVGWMRTLGVEPNYPVEDTQCQAFVLEENHLRYDLDSICERLGIPGKDETLLREALAVYGWPSKGREAKKNIYRLPARYVGPYAEADAVQTLEAWELMRVKIATQFTFNKMGEKIQDPGVERAYRTEMDLVPCVHRMQYDGVRVNVDRAQQRADALYQARDETLAELGRQLGETVVVDSINRGDWLETRFDAAGIPYPRTAPTSRYPDGQPSFTAGSTGWMHKHPHWLPQLVVRAEKQHKAAKDFLEGFVVRPAHNGRIHANINQFKGEDAGGTRTHRFSYADPPLQQMPSRDEELMDAVRGCFEPEDGEEWVSCDYPQQEYRLIVHFAEVLGLPRASVAGDRYRADPNTDYHTMVAEMTSLDRKPAKDANFAKAFGAGVDKFAAMINKTREEAAAIMEQYDRELPFVSALAKTVQGAADRRGYVRLIDGARLHYEQWEPAWRDWRKEQEYLRGGGKLGVAPCDEAEAERRAGTQGHPWAGKRLRRAFTRKAGNGLIQGSAARMTKIAMVLAHREGIRLRLQVHDELNASVARREEGQRLAEIMSHAVRLTVPIVVKAEYGSSWGDVE